MQMQLRTDDAQIRRLVHVPDTCLSSSKKKTLGNYTCHLIAHLKFQFLRTEYIYDLLRFSALKTTIILNTTSPSWNS